MLTIGLVAPVINNYEDIRRYVLKYKEVSGDCCFETQAGVLKSMVKLAMEFVTAKTTKLLATLMEVIAAWATLREI